MLDDLVVYNMRIFFFSILVRHKLVVGYLWLQYRAFIISIWVWG